jgi:DNA-binding LacI/PurR family transcriptional regulator
VRPSFREKGLDLLRFAVRVMAQFVDPPLSTIRLPFDEMGREAARQFVARMEKWSGVGRRVMDFGVVEGRTVASV